MISHLVAATENNAIGKNGQLLWHLPNDLKYFKNLTWGMVVIMGRKTFESVNKPLPGRLNIVITKNKEWKRDGVITAPTIEEAIKYARGEHFKEIFIIGGGEIYRQTMSITDRIYMTRVHANLEGDTFYPEIDKSVFELKSSKPFGADEKHAWPYTFEVWDKK
jgi:dihydrofolate reductase